MPFTPPTLLSLSGPGFDLSEYSLRGLTAEMTPIVQSGQVLRDVNGNAMDLSVAQMRKYRVKITCADQESPGFAAITSDGDGIWPGALVTVTLVPHLGSETPLTLSMIVTLPWRETRNEWGAETSWELELEEV